MKEGKHKPGGLFYITGLFAALVFFSACETPFGGYWEDAFNNETSYTITVTLDKAYKTSTGDSEINTSLYLYSNSSETVYVKSDSVDFSWTARNAEKNRDIYPEKDGSKVRNSSTITWTNHRGRIR
jgi:hypothetical protein